MVFLHILQRMLKNPMYVGDYMYQGKLYPNGKHEPLISKELFKLAQNKLNNNTDRQNYNIIVVY